MNIYSTPEQKAQAQKLAALLEMEGVTNLRNEKHPDSYSLSKLIWFLIDEKLQEMESRNDAYGMYQVNVLFTKEQAKLMKDFCRRNLSEFVRDCTEAYMSIFIEWPDFDDARKPQEQTRNDR
jgi:hypothetical protein